MTKQKPRSSVRRFRMCQGWQGEKTTCPVPGLLWQRGYQACLWSRRKAGGNANSILNDSLCTICVKWLSAKLRGLSAHSDVYYMKRCQTHSHRWLWKEYWKKLGNFYHVWWCLLVWVRKTENGRENSRLGSGTVVPASPFGMKSQAEPNRRKRAWPSSKWPAVGSRQWFCDHSKYPRCSGTDNKVWHKIISCICHPRERFPFPEDTG